MQSPTQFEVDRVGTPRPIRVARRRLVASGCALTVACAASLWSGESKAETYRVGASEQFTDIASALAEVAPGDVVEVMGDQTYSGTWNFRSEHGGTPGNPVTVRGVRVHDRMPVIEGVGSGEWDNQVVLFNASHFVFEGFEVIGDGNEANSCLVHKADQVTIRDVIVHGCGRHGLLGTDDDSGSLTLEYAEFYGNGGGLYYHQIYMATDESAYPGSVFRLQHSYIHDGNGGNSVKSRAERNEIYFNWIEGAVYHELDLIGPDGAPEGLAREDSDVVGNVLIKHSEYRIARIGGDGTGSTGGRYRFVNNTMVLGEAGDRVIDLQQEVESVEMHNNVIFRAAGPGQLFRHNDPIGAAPTLIGSHNWVQTGFTDVPSGWTNTVQGDDPGFLDLAAVDLRLRDGSPLVNSGTAATAELFPAPLEAVAYVPPSRTRIAPGQALTRAIVELPDIGAFELGSGTEPGPGLGNGGSGASGQGGSGQGGSGQGGSGEGGSGQGGSGVGGSGQGGSGSSSQAGSGSAGPGGTNAGSADAVEGGCSVTNGAGSGSGALGLSLLGALGWLVRRRTVRAE